MSLDSRTSVFGLTVRFRGPRERKWGTMIVPHPNLPARAGARFWT
jgi:hypothetical protein